MKFYTYYSLVFQGEIDVDIQGTAQIPSLPSKGLGYTKIGDRNLQNAPGSEVQEGFQNQFQFPGKRAPEKFSAEKVAEKQSDEYLPRNSRIGMCCGLLWGYRNSYPPFLPIILHGLRR
jgi:hypothetical protein